MNETLIAPTANRTTRQATLQELKDRQLPRLDWRDIVKYMESGVLPDDDAKTMAEYFRHFLAPGPCVQCGSKLTGDIVSQFMGQATFTWGIAHGEGICYKCRYPARAYHRKVGPIEFLNLVLQYHPDELELPEEGKWT